MRSVALSRWRWLHTWSSLVCTLFLLVICLTGLPLKIIWALLDLVMIVLLGSGLYLWWASIGASAP